MGKAVNITDLKMEYGGNIFAGFELPASELYGLLAAMVILVLAFGSVLAMGLPIGTALIGLGVGSSLAIILSHVVPMPDFTTSLVAMIGLGVGIDYALFIVTRYREGLAEGLTVEEAVVDAVDTSGRAVIFAGITVIISLLGLFVMSKNIRQRSIITSAARRYLDESGFFEIETPILSNPTPEGARDFLVPSRLNPGRFYALPQAPQQYKQLMMVAGLEKYYQIARCFRDEDLRADRQPEFTQIDIEASFVGQEDIIRLVEGLLASMFKAGLGIGIPQSFPRMTYADAMDIYGSDKPDTRYEMKITDLGDVFAATEFKIFRSTLDQGGVVRAINAKGFAGVTTGQMNRLNEIAIQAGLPVKTLAFIKCEGGEYKSPLWKFFTDAEKDALVAKLAIAEGDIVFFVAGSRESVSTILGRVRCECAEMLELTKNSDAYNFLWVVDFPLLALDEESGHWAAVHHPFTRPNADDAGKLAAGDFANVRAVAYDVVLNGYELGGGSIRIHEKDLQAKMFEVLGVGPEEQEVKFGHILDAFRFGAPPHGGLALGLDRIAMLMAGEDSIREVIAFPKNNKGADLMAHSPCQIDFKQLREVYVQSTWKDPKAEKPVG
jgi:aspartyl-tRNA synthetase